MPAPTARPGVSPADGRMPPAFRQQLRQQRHSGLAARTSSGDSGTSSPGGGAAPQRRALGGGAAAPRAHVVAPPRLEEESAAATARRACGARCSAPTGRARGAARRLRVGRLVVGVGPLPARGLRLGEAPVAVARALRAERIHARLPRRRLGSRHPRQRRPRPPRDAPASLGRPPRAPLRRRVRGGDAPILDQR